MSDTITLTGVIATPPRHTVTGERLAITSFRLASTQRRFDRGQQKWVDGETNWFTVTAFRQLAINVARSVDKGQRVVVTGRLRVRDWTSGDRSGTNVEIDAEALGHDLTFGTAAFERTVTSSSGSSSDAGEPSPSAIADQADAAGDDGGDRDEADATWHAPGHQEPATLAGATPF